MRASNIKRVTATGDVTTADAYLRSVSLANGSDAATLTVRAGGSGGTVVLVLKVGSATAGEAVSTDLFDAFCADGVHATLTGTSPSATFVYA